MPLFRRRRPEPEAESEPPPQPDVPEWAAFMDRDEYAAFLGLVDATLERLGLSDRQWGDGAVDVLVEGERVSLGLGNLVQWSHDAESGEERAALVAEHLAKVVRLSTETREQDWLTVEPLLKLRLWGRADLPSDKVVARAVADDVLAVLSVDWPDQVSTVHPDQLAEWGRTEDELFALARRNTLADPDVEIDRREHDEGPAWLAIGDSFFTATRGLWPEDLVDAPLPDAGVLVALPNRHVAWAFPVEDLRVIGMVSRIAPWIHERHLEGPGSVSPHLYWWRAGAWTRLPLEAGEDAIRFSPPPAFVAVLEELEER